MYDFETWLEEIKQTTYFTYFRTPWFAGKTALQCIRSMYIAPECCTADMRISEAIALAIKLPNLAHFAITVDDATQYQFTGAASRKIADNSGSRLAVERFLAMEKLESLPIGVDGYRSDDWTRVVLPMARFVNCLVEARSKLPRQQQSRLDIMLGVRAFVGDGWTEVIHETPDQPKRGALVENFWVGYVGNAV